MRAAPPCRIDTVFRSFCLVAAVFSVFLLTALHVPPNGVRAETAGASSGAYPVFKRGINLSRLQNFSRSDPNRPGKYMWPPFQGPLSQVSDGELDRLRRLGFDFIRLPVDTGPFLAGTDPERRLLLDGLKTLTIRLIDKGFTVLVDMHPASYNSVWTPKDILADPHGPAFQAYTDLLVQVAKRIRDLPSSKVAFELFNEPQPVCRRTDAEDWTVTQKRLYDEVHRAAPDLPIMLSGPCWSSIDGITRLDPGQYDDRTLFDAHFYSPHDFTHQSIVWSSPPWRYIAGLSYPWDRGSAENTERITRQYLEILRTGPNPPPDDAFDQARKGIRDYYDKKPDLSYIEQRFDRLADWAADHGVAPDRIVIGEFSAWRPPNGLEDDGSRKAWIEDVRKTAESHGFGWALWDYYEGFGLMTDNQARTIDPDTVEALGLDLNALTAGTGQ